MNLNEDIELCRTNAAGELEFYMVPKVYPATEMSRKVFTVAKELLLKRLAESKLIFLDEAHISAPSNQIKIQVLKGRSTNAERD